MQPEHGTPLEISFCPRNVAKLTPSMQFSKKIVYVPKVVVFIQC